MGDTSGAVTGPAARGEDTVREIRLELRAPTTAGISWVQNVLAVALK